MGPRSTNCLRIAAVASAAQLWLMPRLAGFAAAHPEAAIVLDTACGLRSTARRAFDVWIGYVPACGLRRRARGQETLFEEFLRPVCSPRLLRSRTPPRAPGDLAGWPLLRCTGRGETDWGFWWARQGVRAPARPCRAGFGLYSMAVQAAVAGLGVAVGHTSLIARSLEEGVLVPALDRGAEGLRCCLLVAPASRRRPIVRSFIEWIVSQGD